MIVLYRRRQTSRNASQKFMHKGARIFLIAAVAVLACSITVFAWFQANVTNTGNSITTTGYELTVKITDNNQTEVAVTDHKANLNANTSYTVTLAAGDNGASTGYCEIANSSEKWYTGQINKGESFTFTFIPKTGGEYTFTATWGTYTGDPDVKNSGDALKLGSASSSSNALKAPAAPEATKPETKPEEEKPSVEEPENETSSQLESSSEETVSSSTTGSEENTAEETPSSTVSSGETDTENEAAPVVEDPSIAEDASVYEGEIE